MIVTCLHDAVCGGDGMLCCCIDETHLKIHDNLTGRCQCFALCHCFYYCYQLLARICRVLLQCIQMFALVIWYDVQLSYVVLGF